MNAKTIFLKHLAQTSPFPLGLEIDHAEGIYLYDKSGKRYTDLISGVAVSNLGHRHPKIIEALKNQIDKHLFTMVYGENIQDIPNQLAQLLTSFLPENLSTVYLVNSGAEANEGALKLAKRHTGQTELVACHRSYHGGTHGALSVSGNETKKNAFRPLLPDVRFIEFNDENDLSQITERTAGVIIETIQGDAGVRIPSSNYLKKLRKRCDETGAVLIFDEVQVGCGRTGKLFAFEHFGAVPDILTLGKAFGGGMPIGAFVASYEMMQKFTFDPMLGHITTFGGHPVCCASALASLQILTEQNILENVHKKEQLFHQLLQHSGIQEIRSKGLLFAVEMKNAQIVQAVIQNCLKRGIIGFYFLSTPNAFRLAPPLTITEAEIEESCQQIEESITEAIG